MSDTKKQCSDLPLQLDQAPKNARFEGPGKTFLSSGCVLISYSAECNGPKFHKPTDVLRPGWNVPVFTGQTFFGHAFFDVLSDCFSFRCKIERFLHRTILMKNNLEGNHTTQCTQVFLLPFYQKVKFFFYRNHFSSQHYDAMINNNC